MSYRPTQENPMTAPPEFKACAVCARILDRFEPGDGTAPYWRHTPQDGGELADHLPVPVDAADIHTEYRCDFCNTDESAYILPVRTFEAPGLTMSRYNSAGDWSACLGCGRLIELNQWSGLLRRVKKSWEGRHGPMPREIEQSLSSLYRLIRKNQSGGLHPFTRPKPSTGGPGGIQDGQNRASGPEDQ
jgi:hypothetical protein